MQHFVFFFRFIFTSLSLQHRSRDKVGRVVSCTCTAGLLVFFRRTRPPPDSPGAAPPQTHNCSENKCVTRTQVQLQREACLCATSVCGFIQYVAGKDVFISKCVCLTFTWCESIQMSARQTRGAAQLCYSSICLMEALIHRGFKSNYCFPGRPQKNHRFKTTNTFHSNSRRCRSPSGWVEQRAT